MRNTTIVQPRTLVVKLSNDRFLLVMPIHRFECEKMPPHWHFLMKARHLKRLSFFPVARITIDGIWLDRPQIEESILVASFYLPSSKVVDVPQNVLTEVESLTSVYRPQLREAYEYNRSLNFAYDAT